MIRKFLDLSTGHISYSTARWLEDRAADVANAPSHWVAPTPYGWFTYADEENGSGDIPDDLFRVMQKSRELGCDYILFDRDAEADASFLPVFDW